MALPEFSAADLGHMLGIAPVTVRKQLGGLTPDTETAGRRPASWTLPRVIAHLAGDQRRLDPQQESARLAKERADSQAMDNAVRRGELAHIDYFDEQLMALTRQYVAGMDALPMRIRQQLPHLQPVDHATIDGLLADERDALADRLASGASEDPAVDGEGSGDDPQAGAADAVAVG